MNGCGLEIEAALARGEFRAEVSLEVERGDALALLGPNGSGKSTLLRAISGLDPIPAGRIRIDGVTVADTAAGIRLPARERGVGYVFQDYRLFPHLNVLDNVAFGLRTGGESRRSARKLALATLARAGMDGFAGALPADLSGGEAQRVAVARALAGSPGLLLLDEPLAALDVENRAAMREHVSRMVERFDATVLLVTHDPGDALAVSDRIAIIEGGRILQRGTGRELSAAPASAYVARLVGRTGIGGEVAPETVVRPGGEVRFETASGPMTGLADAVLPGDGFPAGPVFASFNPAAVRIGPAGGESRAPNFRADSRVLAVERGLGHTSFELDLSGGDGTGGGGISGGHGSGTTPVRAAVSADRAERFGPGDRVSVEIPPDAVQVTPVPPAGSPS